MIEEELKIDGKTFSAYSISLNPAPFLLIRSADKSFLACGFLDIAAADSLSSCAAKVRGVKTFNDMLGRRNYCRHKRSGKERHSSRNDRTRSAFKILKFKAEEEKNAVFGCLEREKQCCFY